MRLDAYSRERQMVESGAVLPETASGLVGGCIGNARHGAARELERGVMVGATVVPEDDYFAGLAFPEPEQRLLFIEGWRLAAEGWERSALYRPEFGSRRMVVEAAKAMGWDEYRRVRLPREDQMGTGTQTFERKGLYHSDLVKHGELAVMLTGKPRESTYPGKPPFVGLKVHGDYTAYTLSIETAEIRADLDAAPLNTWIVLKAAGSREQACLIIEDANGNPVLKDTPPQEIAQPSPPPLWPQDSAKAPITPPPTTDADTAVRTALAHKYFLALCAADDAVQRFAKEHAGSQPSDAVRNIATTLYIQANGR